MQLKINTTLCFRKKAQHAALKKTQADIGSQN